MAYRDPVHVGAFASDVTINAVIETPAGSRIKYKWEPDAGGYRAGRVLPLGMAFPFDFGFVPGTKAEDGDPLDVLVLADAPLAIGVVVECRVLGAFEVEQSTGDAGTKLVRNDRLVAIPSKALRGAEWSSLEDVGVQLREQIGSFFTSYVERQGREIKLLGTVQPKRALKLVAEAKR